jgi:multicomponent Na+:H+ antiporter subunit B
MNIPVELPLFILHLMTAVLIARMRGLFSAAMLTGIFSLLSCCLFVLMDAVDVAFTEAAVGAGISTVLILGTLALTAREEKQQRTRLMPFVVVFVTGAALIYGTMDMHAFGVADAPIHNHPIIQTYIHGAHDDFHIPNIVTVILGSYRGYDTLGETAVIFTAGVGVLLLLADRRGGSPRPTTEPDPGTTPTDDGAVSRDEAP